MREIITSSIRQGFQCPLDCPDILDLWESEESGAKALICSECEAAWDVDEDLELDDKYFLENLEEGVKRKYFAAGDLKLLRIMDHRLFNVSESEFPDLIGEAWQGKNDLMGHRHIPRSIIIDMQREIGKNRERCIDVHYDKYMDQIVDALPVHC